MTKIRVKRVVWPADFRKSEATLFEEFRKTNKAFVDAMTSGEAVCFMSSGANQMTFVWRPIDIEYKPGHFCPIVTSRRARAPKHREIDLRLMGNYAQEVGLEIEGNRLFQEHFKEYADIKAARREEKTAG